MKTIIFDMDGTLIDSSKTITKTVNFMRGKLGLMPEKDDIIMEIISNPNKNWAKDLYNEENLSKDFFLEAERNFENNYKTFSSLYDGILSLLSECKNHGFLLAVASNAPECILIEILKSHKIENYFFKIIGASKTIPQKPNPLMLELIKKEQKFDEVWFVGDSQKDFEAANNANINYIHALWGFGEVKGAKFYAKQPIHTLDFLTKNTKKEWKL